VTKKIVDDFKNTSEFKKEGNPHKMTTREPQLRHLNKKIEKPVTIHKKSLLFPSPRC